MSEKRRPGRPRKRFADVNSGESRLSPPKKRGRPPKKLIDEPVLGPPSPPKKRGRPPKRALAEHLSAHEQEIKRGKSKKTARPSSHQSSSGESDFSDFGNFGDFSKLEIEFDDSNSTFGRNSTSNADIKPSRHQQGRPHHDDDHQEDPLEMHRSRDSERSPFLDDVSESTAPTPPRPTKHNLSHYTNMIEFSDEAHENDQDHQDDQIPSDNLEPNGQQIDESPVKLRASRAPQINQQPLLRLERVLHRAKDLNDPPTLSSVNILLIALGEKLLVLEDRIVKISKTVAKISSATMTAASYAISELPMDSISEAISYEKLLKSKVAERKNLIKNLKQQIGHSNSHSMNNTIKYLFTDDFIVDYNLTGVSGKKCFRGELKYFYNLIIEAWDEQPIKGHDLDGVIRKALEQAKSRKRKQKFQLLHPDGKAGNKENAG